jgi:transposase, IS30 family
MMLSNYSRLSLQERFEIEKLLSHKTCFADIARSLKRSKSCICREVTPYGKRKYKAMTAHWFAVSKSSSKRFGQNKIVANKNIGMYVLQKLELRWSPEQISKRMIKDFPEDPNMRISHEAIYLYVYLHAKPEVRKMLQAELRQKRKFRGNVRRGTDKRTKIVDPVRIDERPKEVIGREIPGHWEGDLIVGKEHQSAIGSLVERTTRAIILVHLKAMDATTVRKAFEKEFQTIPRQMKLTLTYDNGSEMSQHKLFTKHTKINVYFTHPYSPWERPTNENSNGLVRDYFPKGTDFNLISKARLKEVQHQLNERPRKVLDYNTPKEVFDDLILKEIK